MQSALRKLVAEGIGTCLLVATVVGSGIMAERLSGGNLAVALLGNTLATGAILCVLIQVLGPLSGAHFNPAVTLVFTLPCAVKSAPHSRLPMSRFNSPPVSQEHCSPISCSRCRSSNIPNICARVSGR